MGKNYLAKLSERESAETWKVLKSFQQTSLAICLEEAEPDKRQQPARARAAARCCRCSGTSAMEGRLANISTCSPSCGTSVQTMGLILCKGRRWHPLWWPSVGAVGAISRSPEGQGVITTSDCSNSCTCSRRARLYMQGWTKEEYGIRRDFHKCTRIWVWEVTEEDEVLWLAGCRRLLWVSWPGRPAALVQMSKKQRMTGLFAGKPVPKIRWHWKASAEISDSANIYILFAFRGITHRSKITQPLKDWHGGDLKQSWDILNIIY